MASRAFSSGVGLGSALKPASLTAFPTWLGGVVKFCSFWLRDLSAQRLALVIDDDGLRCVRCSKVCSGAYYDGGFPQRSVCWHQLYLAGVQHIPEEPLKQLVAASQWFDHGFRDGKFARYDAELTCAGSLPYGLHQRAVWLDVLDAVDEPASVMGPLSGRVSGPMTLAQFLGG